MDFRLIVGIVKKKQNQNYAQKRTARRKERISNLEMVILN